MYRLSDNGVGGSVKKSQLDWWYIGGTEEVGRSKFLVKLVSIKQWVEPESMRVEKVREELETNGEESEVQSEFGSESADVLSWTTSDDAQGESMLPSAYAEV